MLFIKTNTQTDMFYGEKNNHHGVTEQMRWNITVFLVLSNNSIVNCKLWPNIVNDDAIITCHIDNHVTSLIQTKTKLKKHISCFKKYNK